MKKFLKTMMTALVIAPLALVFAACGPSTPSVLEDGTYKSDFVYVNNESLTPSEGIYDFATIRGNITDLLNTIYEDIDAENDGLWEEDVEAAVNLAKNNAVNALAAFAGSDTTITLATEDGAASDEDAPRQITIANAGEVNVTGKDFTVDAGVLVISGATLPDGITLQKFGSRIYVVCDVYAVIVKAVNDNFESTEYRDTLLNALETEIEQYTIEVSFKLQ